MNAQTSIRRCTKLNSLLQPDTSSLPFTVSRKRANKIDNFLPALAHEVRNPLSTINMAAQMLNQTCLNEEQVQLLDIILRGSDRIKELINSLLASVRPDETVYELYSPHQLLEEALLMTKDRILLKNIIVSKEYTKTDCRVRVDREMMKIALINIIINAIDAIPSEGGLLKLATKYASEHLTLEIQDNGIGINKNSLKNLFKPYFTKKKGGMGLGLSVTLDILKANHAGVDLRSEEGVGTCFLISFDNALPSA